MKAVGGGGGGLCRGGGGGLWMEEMGGGCKDLLSTLTYFVEDILEWRKKILLTLPLSRVINLKFPLQSHQKYNISSMKNLAFHSLLR